MRSADTPAARLRHDSRRVGVAAARPVALTLSVCLAAVSVAAAPADTAPAIQNIGADQESQSLLVKVEQQILSGRTVAPLEDNALTTWEEVRRKAQAPTPAFKRAVQDFIKQSENRATAERAAGRDMVAFDLQAFADMAQELLQRGAALPPVADQSSEQRPESAAASASAGAAPPPAPGSVKLPAAVAPAPAAATAPPVDPAAGSVKPSSRDAALALAAPVPPASRQPTPAQERMAVTLAGRGDAMLAIKDISAARKLYEQAANLGSASAAAELARTYDPSYVGKLDIIGIRPDLTMAANWYVRAAALGDQQAAQRMREIDAMLGASRPTRATP